MSSNISHQSSNVFIPKTEFGNALQKIKKFLKAAPNPEEEVFNVAEVLKSKTFEEALGHACFAIHQDGEGNIDALEYTADQTPRGWEAPFGLLKSFGKCMRVDSYFTIASDEEQSKFTLQIEKSRANIYFESLPSHSLIAQRINLVPERDHANMPSYFVGHDWTVRIGSQAVYRIQLKHLRAAAQRFALDIEKAPIDCIFEFSQSEIGVEETVQLTIQLPNTVGDTKLNRLTSHTPKGWWSANFNVLLRGTSTHTPEICWHNITLCIMDYRPQ